MKILKTGELGTKYLELQACLNDPNATVEQKQAALKAHADYCIECSDELGLNIDDLNLSATGDSAQTLAAPALSGGDDDESATTAAAPAISGDTGVQLADGDGAPDVPAELAEGDGTPAEDVSVAGAAG